MKVMAISGANGFIGRYLVDHVTRAGHRAVPLPRTTLADPEAALTGVDVVIHSAGRAHVLKEDAANPAAAFHEANVALTEKLVLAARRSGVRRFVLISSAGVLGNVTDAQGVSDDARPRPYDAYSRSKLAGEEAAGAAGAGIELVIVRPPVVYGPGARGNFGRIVHAVRSGWPLPAGSLRAPRSIVGLRNLADFLLLAAVHPRAPGPAMLVSDAEPVSVRDLALAIGHALDRRPLLVPFPVPLFRLLLTGLGKRADIPRMTQPWVVRPARALTELGWRPPYTLAEELAWTVSGTDKAS